MTVELLSLAFIALIAVACPVIAQAIPGRPIPETVLLLVFGAVFGPHLVGFITLTDSFDFLSDLGMAFLFLLAGYEIDAKKLTGSQGKQGLVCWVVTFALAFLVVYLVPFISSDHIGFAAIALTLTTTAFGTLVPILKERGLSNTPVGDAVIAYGTWGELGPVIAMALLLSTRAKIETILVLLVFALLAVIVAVLPARARRVGSKMVSFLTENADTTAQAMVRVTILLLVGLVAISAAFDLDIVLGSFAAGFVLRYILTAEGHKGLEIKLDAIAYGFLIPIFFVVSGARIDLSAVLARPGLLVGFIIMLMLIRAVPAYVSLSVLPKPQERLSTHHRLTVALYCTTALPLIVAVTTVAVDAGTMAQETASVLVAAGAVTVFLMPFLASITYRVADARPIEAAREIAEDPKDAGPILRRHVKLAHVLARGRAAADAGTDHFFAAAAKSAVKGGKWAIEREKIAIRHLERIAERGQVRNDIVNRALDAQRARLAEVVSEQAEAQAVLEEIQKDPEE